MNILDPEVSEHPPMDLLYQVVPMFQQLLQDGPDINEVNQAISLGSFLVTAPSSDPYLRSSLLNFLATSLMRRFTLNGDDANADLDAAISLLERIDYQLLNQSDRAQVQENLSEDLFERFKRDGNRSDFSGALENAMDALDATPSGPERPRRLNNLVVLKNLKHQMDDDSSALVAAEFFSREAVERSRSTLTHSTYLENHLMVLLACAQRFPDSDHLDRAIGLVQELDKSLAQAFAPIISAIYHERFMHDRDGSDLDFAIHVLEAALADHQLGQDRATMLSNLAACLLLRFDFAGYRDDLDRAVSLSKEALYVGGPDIVHSNIAAKALWQRFQAGHDLGDLDRAIEHAEDALGFRTVSHDVNICIARHSLATLLLMRFELEKNESDWERAFEIVSTLKDSDFGDHLAWMYGNLVSLLHFARFRVSGERENLDRAIEVLEEATDEEHSQLGRLLLLNNLGHILIERFEHSEQEHDSTRSIECLHEVAYSDETGIALTLSAVANLSRIATRAGMWEQATAVAHRAQVLVNALIGSLGLSASLWLEPLQGVAVRGAFAATHLGRLDEALGLLEGGQGVLVAERLAGLRMRLEDAAEIVPHLVDQYRKDADRVARLLRVPSELDFPDSSSTVDFLPQALVELSESRANLEVEIGPLLEVVGMNDIVLVAAKSGDPLVYLFATEVGGAAITVDPHGGRSAKIFDHLTKNQVGKWVQRLAGEGEDGTLRRGPKGTTGGFIAQHDAVVEVLGEVMDALGELCVFRRIRLVPTGLFATLPISAALAQGELTCIVAVSAQVHLAALARPRPRPPQHEGIEVFADPAPCSPALQAGLGNLLGARAEAAFLEEQFGALNFSGLEAKRDRVLEALRKPLLAVHLSVHGIADASDPLKNALLLADHRNGDPAVLTVRDISREEIQPWLLFLASCWLGSSGTLLAHEAIGFPTVLCERGAGATVAPLWPVGDEACRDLVEHFYKALEEGHSPAEALATYQRTADVGLAATWAAFSATGW